MTRPLRTSVINSLEQVIEIFIQAGLDDEWAGICAARYMKDGIFVSEEKVRAWAESEKRSEGTY